MRRAPRIGLALAGGGPLGAIYEIGALCALEEALEGVAFADIEAYVGVSAGGFIAAGLANRMTPRELCASFIENVGPAHDIFQPSVLLRPAWGEIARGLARLPALAAQAVLLDALAQRSLSGALERLGRALPAGFFSNARIDTQLRRQFAVPGRSNDFRELGRRLVLVATDLDSGAAAPFGLPGLDHVPISKAVQASAALPGLFPPVEIDGRHYVDGALKKTMHASVLLDEGVDLLFCLNPLVPFDAGAADGAPRAAPLADGGLPVVLSQALRTLIRSRLELGMKAYARSHPRTTIVLVEPDPRDAVLFFANTFSCARRRALAEHAYRQTRALLRAQRATLAPRLRRHGIGLRDAVLEDASRTLLGASSVPRRRPPAAMALARLGQTLDALEQVLPAVARINRRAPGTPTAARPS